MKPSQEKREKLTNKLIKYVGRKKILPEGGIKITKTEAALIIQTFMHFEAEEDSSKVKLY